jgi:uroporphyrinogen-III decarboxylase
LTTTQPAMSIQDRVDTVLKHQKPDRVPFIDRLEIWYRVHSRAGTMPPEYRGLSLTEIHRLIGIGQQVYLVPYAYKMHGVEVIGTFNGQVFYHEHEPVMEFFCGISELAGCEEPGLTEIELITPVGKLRAQHELLPENILSGTEPYLKEHLIKEEEDYRTLEYILEKQEYVPHYEKVAQEQARLGGIGYVVPMTPRVPFQQVLLEYLGEIPLFYALSDNPQKVKRLMRVLDIQLTEILHRLADLDAPYIEFPDNLDGLMTNPRLFTKFSLPYYQRYCDILHAQGKYAGSHTDGNVKPLLTLLAESGLDVCESFSPTPLTPCTFEEAWTAWQAGPLIWGGFPSPILEERTPEAEFVRYVQEVLNLVEDKPIILGVGDMVMGHNSIERLRYIVEQVEGRPLI